MRVCVCNMRMRVTSEPVPSIHDSPWYPAWNTSKLDIVYPYISEADAPARAAAEDAYVEEHRCDSAVGRLCVPLSACVCACNGPFLSGPLAHHGVIMFATARVRATMHGGGSQGALVLGYIALAVAGTRGWLWPATQIPSATSAGLCAAGEPRACSSMHSRSCGWWMVGVG